MSLLSEIKAAVTGCGLSVETGVFSGEPPEEYVVVTLWRTPMNSMRITSQSLKPRSAALPVYQRQLSEAKGAAFKGDFIAA